MKSIKDSQTEMVFGHVKMMPHTVELPKCGYNWQIQGLQHGSL